MYNPALTRGLHGRAARCIWALVSQRGTHEALPQGGLHLVLCLGRLGVPARWLDTNALPLRSRPSSKLSRRWYARSRCRGQGQGVRDGELVRVPESRCSGVPLLTCKQFAWGIERGRDGREAITMGKLSVKSKSA